MNFNTILQAQAAGGANYSFLIMMALIFAVMYFFMIRPQQKKQKELANFRKNLAKGDKVVTIGGIYGVVAEVKESYILVTVANEVRLKFDKSAIVKDISDLPQTK